jgi:hypothetical protein
MVAHAPPLIRGVDPPVHLLARRQIGREETMSAGAFAIGVCGLTIAVSTPAFAQQVLMVPGDDPTRGLVGRLDLERYKATIRGLGQFGDRQQGTDRNRAAVDWIEAQLRGYGCSTDRVRYVYNAPGLARDQHVALRPPGALIKSGDIVTGLGGARIRGITLPIAPNNNPAAQTDPSLRALNEGPSTPGPREEVYCTKVGSTRPDEMYIVGAHMDGRGFGEAADDNGSGTALVMELARVFSGPDVVTERSIRFALWNNEETGFQGATAYVAQRGPLQGREDPPGSGRYPEPRWLAMIQHDMLLWDHGMPRADGTIASEQRPEADFNIEFQSTTKFAAQAMGLAFFFRDANEQYATDYPAAVGNHMVYTDSNVFMNVVPTISLREKERGMQIGAGWNPHYHQATDRYASYSDKDFRLGLNATQTTLPAVAQLTGAALKK